MNFKCKVAFNSLILSSAAFLIAGASHAADRDMTQIVGKTPKVAGKKPKDPNNAKGTRKLPSFFYGRLQGKIQHSVCQAYD